MDIALSLPASDPTPTEICIAVGYTAVVTVTGSTFAWPTPVVADTARLGLSAATAQVGGSRFSLTGRSAGTTTVTVTAPGHSTPQWQLRVAVVRVS